MYRYKEISRGVLLSPGLDYRGVKTESAMKGLEAAQKVWIIAAENDEYSADSTKLSLNCVPKLQNQLYIAAPITAPIYSNLKNADS